MGKGIYSLCAGIGLLFAAAQASAVTIEDNYIGSNDHGYGDVIADSWEYDHYNVRNMDVIFDAMYMTVRVNTSFSEATDNYGVQYGDLFISTNGWHPAGSASDGYRSDNASNGEHWEFVFDTSAQTLIGGNFTNYNSEHFFDPNQYIFRDGQEVQYASGGTSVGGSSVDLSHAGTNGYIEYNILWSSLGITGPADIGLKWGMTCANDSIEGQVSVPEPGALMLLGLGLLGLGVTARKRAR